MGPGLSVIDGYERTNRVQRDAGESQMRQAMTGLQLADKVQQMQKAEALRRAYSESGGDLNALEGALIRHGAIGDADKVRNMRGERDFQTEVQGALTPDGAVDWSKVTQASVKHGRPGALNASYRAETAAAKVADAKRQRGALQFLLGDPEETAAPVATDGALASPAEEGGMPAPTAAPKPRRRGALAEYEASDNPAIRRQAQLIREQVQAGALDPKDAVAQLRDLAKGDIRVGVEANREAARDEREERRQSDVVRWDSKRGVGLTRGGEVVLPKDLPGLPPSTGGAGGPGGAAGAGGSAGGKAESYARWRIKTLIESGMPPEDAARIVAGGAGLNMNENTVARMAASLMKITKDDMVTPLYPSLGAAMQAVREATGGNRPPTVASGALAPAPGSMPGSLSAGADGRSLPGPAAPSSAPRAPQSSARSQIPPGLPAGSKQIGTSKGKPVFEAPDGKRYIQD